MAMFRKLRTKAGDKARKKTEKEEKKLNKKRERSSRKGRRKRKIAILMTVLAVLFVALVFYIIKDARTIKVSYYNVSFESVPAQFDGYRILVIGDIKGDTFGREESRLSKKIASLSYDMVLMTGDYLESYDSEDTYIISELLEKLPEDVPVYYVLGDKDLEDPDASDPSYMCLTEKDNAIENVLRSSGAVPVYPIAREEKDGAYIFFTGIKYNEKVFDKADFDPDRDFSICVTHAPIMYNVTKRLAEVNVLSQKEVDFDLEISGHTLGGTVRLPILGALYTKAGGPFPEEKYVAGMHQIGDGRVSIITSGLGTERGFRLFNTPEIVLITLHSVTS